MNLPLMFAALALALLVVESATFSSSFLSLLSSYLIGSG